MYLFATPNWSVERKRKEKRRKGRGKNHSKLLLSCKICLILHNKSYLNCVDVAGLDYEKVWYKGLGQVIRKTMVSKALLWKL